MSDKSERKKNTCIPVQKTIIFSSIYNKTNESACLHQMKLNCERYCDCVQISLDNWLSTQLSAAL